MVGWMGMDGYEWMSRRCHAVQLSCPPTPLLLRLETLQAVSPYISLYLHISPYISLYLRLEALQAALMRRRSAALGAHSETPSYSASPLPAAAARA